jgi:hypothetical protein
MSSLNVMQRYRRPKDRKKEKIGLQFFWSGFPVVRFCGIDMTIPSSCRTRRANSGKAGSIACIAILTMNAEYRSTDQGLHVFQKRLKVQFLLAEERVRRYVLLLDEVIAHGLI